MRTAPLHRWLATVALGGPSSAAIDKAVSEQLVERVAELRVEERLAVRADRVRADTLAMQEEALLSAAP